MKQMVRLGRVEHGLQKIISVQVASHELWFLPFTSFHALSIFDLNVNYDVLHQATS